MDQVKIENYQRENPGRDFPNYLSLGTESCKNIRSDLFEKLKLDPLVGCLKLVCELDRQSEICDDIRCDSDDFDLKNVLKSLGLDTPEFVFINWYRYDDIDKIEFVDLANNFDDIWYPQADDIDIFDRSLQWILSITHDGRIKVLKF